MAPSGTKRITAFLIENRNTAMTAPRIGANAAPINGVSFSMPGE